MMDSNYLGNNLIFIISQPRSGSTLLQRILAGHPEIQTSAETWLLLHPTYALRGSGIETEYDAHFAMQAVEEFIENYSDGMGVYDNAIREWANTIYGNVLRRNKKPYFLDKTPRYFFIIPDLYRLFPKAKFIFLLRNPLAVLSSILSTYVKKDWPVISVFRHDLLNAPRLILDGIKVIGDDAIIIRYEDLVAAPKNYISKLCQRLDITYREEMIDYSHTPAPIGKLNDPVGIHQHTRPSVQSLDKWKDLSSNPQSFHFAQSYIHALGVDTINNLGYSFTELSKFFDATGHISPKRGKVFPWSMAIRARNEWTFREQFLSDKYFSTQQKGPIRGSLAAIKMAIKRGVAHIKFQLSNRQS